MTDDLAARRTELLARVPGARNEYEAIDILCRQHKGLAEMMAAFQIASPWTRLYFLTSAEPALHGQTPLEALRAINEQIEGYGEQGG